MSKKMKFYRGLVFATILMSLAIVNPVMAVSDVTVNVNWPDFMAKSDQIWNALPTLPLHAPCIGNGLLGTYLIQDATSGEIRFEMSRNDLTDVRSNFKVRKTNGYFKLVLTDGAIKSGACRVHFWDSELESNIVVKSSTLTIKAFADANSDVIIFELTKNGPDADFTWNWVPDTRGYAGGTPNPYVQYPAPILSTYANCYVSTQDMPVSATYLTENEPAASQHATAWRIVEDSGKTYIYTSVGYSWRASTAKQEAVDNINNAIAKGFASVQNAHRAWWHNFYQKSFVTLPGRFEKFHWMNMRKIASNTRVDSMTDLGGPWFDRNLFWNGVWVNWNIQKHYSNVFTSNHPEMSDAVLNWLYEKKDNFYDAASGGYSIYGGGLGMNDPKPGPHAYCIPWLLQLSWERYQCTMDTSVFNKMYPLLKGVYDYMMYHYMFVGTDGKLHTIPLRSHEFNGDGTSSWEDTTYQLSVFKWMCRTMIKINDIVGGHDADAAAAQHSLDIIAPYYIHPDQGFMIGKGQTFNHAHRHDSHELVIFPFYEYLPSDPVQRDVIEKTLVQHKLMGFEPFAMAESTWAIMHAMLGNGDLALEGLAGTSYAVMNNAYLSPLSGRFAHFGTGYCEEQTFLGDRVIQEMLLQGWEDGIIRVFPGVPTNPEWTDLAFSDFLAKGAFLVSAKRESGVTTFIKVKSLAGSTCKVKTGMSGTVKVASNYGCTLTDLGDGIVQVNGLDTNEWCILYTGASIPNLTIEPVVVTMTFARYDFGTVGSPVKSDFRQVTESTVYTPGGFGWVDTGGNVSRDRLAPTDLERDLVYNASSPGVFKVSPTVVR